MQFNWKARFVFCLGGVLGWDAPAPGKPRIAPDTPRTYLGHGSDTFSGRRWLQAPPARPAPHGLAPLPPHPGRNRAGRHWAGGAAAHTRGGSRLPGPFPRVGAVVEVGERVRVGRACPGALGKGWSGHSPVGNAAGCVPPVCPRTGRYSWQVL